MVSVMYSLICVRVRLVLRFGDSL